MRNRMLAIVMAFMLTMFSLPGYAHVLSKGSASFTDIMEMQRQLAALAYLTDGDVDGDFGSKTEKAVKAFQQSNGLEITGIADEITQATMYERTAIPASGFVPESTVEPTPVPEIRNGYISSDDALLKVNSVVKIHKKETGKNYIMSIEIVDTLNSSKVSIDYERDLSDLFLFANSDDEAHSIKSNVVRCDALVDGVYIITFDIILGSAVKTYTGVTLVDKHFDSFSNGDMPIIERCTYALRGKLKNPNSLIMRSVTATNYTERSAVLYIIEYSAQNVLGGYSVDTYNFVYKMDTNELYEYDYASWMNEKYLNDSTARIYTYKN